MSLNYTKLPTALVMDNRMNFDEQHSYAVLRGSKYVTYRKYYTTSISSTSITVDVPPTSTSNVMDRKIYFVLPVRITFTGLAPIGSVLINPNTDAPRAYPIAQACDVQKIVLNGQTMTVNTADITSGLLRFQIDPCLAEKDFSLTPTYWDQSQQYSDLFGSNRNPLGSYGDSNFQSCTPRGGFPYTIVSQTVSTSSSVPITSVVDFVCTEPIFVSPILWGKGNGLGFINVAAFQAEFTFIAQAANRMWSHDSTSGVGSTITSSSVQFNNFGVPFSYADNQPYILANFLEPTDIQRVPGNHDPVTFPYWDIQRYITDSQNSIAPGASWTATSNNIQLSSIPQKGWIFARMRNSDLYASCTNTDSFFSLEQLNLQFGSANNLFGSADKRQLYEVSLRNGLDMNWMQFSGESVYATGSNSSKISGCGSVFCFSFATDIGLPSLDSPGKNISSLNFQISAQFINRGTAAITPSLYIIFANEGVFTINNVNRALTNIGVLSSDDILNAQKTPGINYSSIVEYGAGNFLSGLKNFGRNALDFLKSSKILSSGLSLIPHPAGKVGSMIASALGLGEGEDEGMGEGCCEGNGVNVGGRKVHRRKLLRRLR